MDVVGHRKMSEEPEAALVTHKVSLVTSRELLFDDMVTGLLLEWT